MQQRGLTPEQKSCDDMPLTECRDNLDTSSESEVQPTSDDVLCLEYSMAIVRMVNGISDKAQKGRVATSVAQNAAAAGMLQSQIPLTNMRHHYSAGANYMGNVIETSMMHHAAS